MAELVWNVIYDVIYIYIFKSITSDWELSDFISQYGFRIRISFPVFNRRSKNVFENYRGFGVQIFPISRFVSVARPIGTWWFQPLPRDVLARVSRGSNTRARSNFLFGRFVRDYHIIYAA